MRPIFSSASSTCIRNMGQLAAYLTWMNHPGCSLTTFGPQKNILEAAQYVITALDRMEEEGVAFHKWMTATYSREAQQRGKLNLPVTVDHLIYAGVVTLIDSEGHFRLRRIDDALVQVDREKMDPRVSALAFYLWNQFLSTVRNTDAKAAVCQLLLPKDIITLGKDPSMQYKCWTRSAELFANLENHPKKSSAQVKEDTYLSLTQGEVATMCARCAQFISRGRSLVDSEKLIALGMARDMGQKTVLILSAQQYAQHLSDMQHLANQYSKKFQKVAAPLHQSLTQDGSPDGRSPKPDGPSHPRGK